MRRRIRRFVGRVLLTFGATGLLVLVLLAGASALFQSTTAEQVVWMNSEIAVARGGGHDYLAHIGGGRVFVILCEPDCAAEAMPIAGRDLDGMPLSARRLVPSALSVGVGGPAGPVVAFDDQAVVAVRCLDPRCAKASTATAQGRAAATAIGIDERGLPVVLWHDADATARSRGRTLRLSRCAHESCTTLETTNLDVPGRVDQQRSYRELAVVSASSSGPVLLSRDGPMLRVTRCADARCSAVESWVIERPGALAGARLTGARLDAAFVSGGRVERRSCDVASCVWSEPVVIVTTPTSEARAAVDPDGALVAKGSPGTFVWSCGDAPCTQPRIDALRLARTYVVDDVDGRKTLREVSDGYRGGLSPR